MSDLDTFLVQSLAFISLAAIAGVATYTYLVTKRKVEPKHTNYKNISLMAQNLSVCKPSSREAVITELYNSSEWTSEEVDELRGVLEGMLNTKLYISKPGEKPNKGLKTL
jgi:hypothetical protein